MGLAANAFPLWCDAPTTASAGAAASGAGAGASAGAGAGADAEQPIQAGDTVEVSLADTATTSAVMRPRVVARFADKAPASKPEQQLRCIVSVVNLAGGVSVAVADVLGGKGVVAMVSLPSTGPVRMEQLVDGTAILADVFRLPDPAATPGKAFVPHADGAGSFAWRPEDASAAAARRSVFVAVPRAVLGADAGVLYKRVRLASRGVVVREFGFSPHMASAATKGGGRRGAPKPATGDFGLVTPVSLDPSDVALVAFPASALVSAGVAVSGEAAKAWALSALSAAGVGSDKVAEALRLAPLFGAPLPLGAAASNVAVVPVFPRPASESGRVPQLVVGDEVSVEVVQDFVADAAGAAGPVACTLAQGAPLVREIGVVTRFDEAACLGIIRPLRDSHAEVPFVASSLIGVPEDERRTIAADSVRASLTSSDPWDARATAILPELGPGSIVAFETAVGTARGAAGRGPSRSSGSSTRGARRGPPAGASADERRIHAVRVRILTSVPPPTSSTSAAASTAAAPHAPGSRGASAAAVRRAAEAAARGATDSARLMPADILVSSDRAVQHATIRTFAATAMPAGALDVKKTCASAFDSFAALSVEHAVALARYVALVPAVQTESMSAAREAGASFALEALPFAPGDVVSDIRALIRNPRVDEIRFSTGGAASRVAAGIAGAAGLRAVVDGSHLVVAKQGAAAHTSPRKQRGRGFSASSSESKPGPVSSAATAPAVAQRTWIETALASKGAGAFVMVRASLAVPQVCGAAKGVAPGPVAAGDSFTADIRVIPGSGSLVTSNVEVTARAAPAFPAAAPSARPSRGAAAAAAATPPRGAQRGEGAGSTPGDAAKRIGAGDASGPWPRRPAAPPSPAKKASAAGDALAPNRARGVVLRRVPDKAYFFISRDDQLGSSGDLFAPPGALRSGGAEGALSESDIHPGLVVEFHIRQDRDGRDFASDIVRAPATAPHPMRRSRASPVAVAVAVEPAALPKLITKHRGSRGHGASPGVNPGIGSGLCVVLPADWTGGEGASAHVAGHLPSAAAAARAAIGEALSSADSRRGGPPSSRRGAGSSTDAKSIEHRLLPTMKPAKMLGVASAATGSSVGAVVAALRPLLDALVAVSEASNTEGRVKASTRGRARGKGPRGAAPQHAAATATAAAGPSPRQIADTVQAILDALPSGAFLALDGASCMKAVAQPSDGKSRPPALVAGDELQVAAEADLASCAQALHQLVTDAAWKTESDKPAAVWQAVSQCISLTDGRVMRASSARIRGLVSRTAADGAHEVTIDRMGPTLTSALGKPWGALRLIGGAAPMLPSLDASRWGGNSGYRAGFHANECLPDLRMSIHPLLRHIGAADAGPAADAAAGSATAASPPKPPRVISSDARSPPTPVAAPVAAAASADLDERASGSDSPFADAKTRGGGRGDLPECPRLSKGDVVEFSLVPPSLAGWKPTAVRVVKVAREGDKLASELITAAPDHPLWMGPKAKRVRINATLRESQAAAGTPRGGAVEAASPSQAGFEAGRGRGRGRGRAVPSPMAALGTVAGASSVKPADA